MMNSTESVNTLLTRYFSFVQHQVTRPMDRCTLHKLVHLTTVQVFIFTHNALQLFGTEAK